MKSINQYILFIIASVFFIYLGVYAFFYRPESPIALTDGVVDYTNFSFSDTDTYSINEFFYIDATASDAGFTCYKLKLSFPEEVNDITIRIPSIYSEFSFYVNEKLLYSQTSHDINYIPFPQILPLRLGEDKSVEIKMYVKDAKYFSSLSFLNPINTNDLIIGSPNAIYGSQRKKDISNTLVVIAAILCAMYHIISLSYKREQLSHLYIAIFSLTISVCLLFNSQATIYHILPKITLSLYIRIYLISFFIKIISLLFYLFETLKNYVRNILFIITNVAIIIFIILTLIVNQDYLYFMFPILFIFTLFVILTGLYDILFVTTPNVEHISYVGIGLIAMIYGLYTEYLYLWSDHSYFSSFSLVQLGFVLLQSFIVSKQYHESVNIIQTISPRLHESFNELQNNPSTYISTHIKPHFLYETLDSIDGYIDKDADKVDHLIQSLAKYLRQALDFSIDPTKYSFKKEIDNCYAYSDLVKEQNHAIRFTFNIDENLPNTYLPQQAVLALIENSVENAFTGILQPAIEISADKKDNNIVISVKDNGIGMTENEINTALTIPSPNMEICLYYINNQLINNFNSQLNITSSSKTGTTISFSIPIVEVDDYE